MRRNSVNPSLADHLRFTGFIKDVEAVVKTSEIGIMAKPKEGFSNSIMEYIGLGKPVVATKGGGTEQLITSGETGLLVDRQDPIALAEAVEALLNDPEARSRMGRAGRSRIEAECSLEKIGGEFVALYDQVAAPAAARDDSEA
jgi:glycosyltransferase involved in cell wall biosynthesis